MRTRNSPGVARIRCDQLAPQLGNVETNRTMVTQSVQRALVDDVDVLVLPELVTSGYVFTDTAEARQAGITTQDPLFHTITGLLANTDTVVVLGFCERDDDRVWNSAALIDASGVRAVYRKTHLWDRETLIFTPGDAAPPVITTAHGRIGLLICYDMEFPEMTRSLGLAGADLIAVPTNWPVGEHPAAERTVEVIAAQAAARANGLFIACCDRQGTERGQDWNQASVIVDQFGWVLAEARPEQPAPGIQAEIFPLLARDKATSPHNHPITDRRPDVYAQGARPV